MAKLGDGLLSMEMGSCGETGGQVGRWVAKKGNGWQGWEMGC